MWEWNYCAKFCTSRLQDLPKHQCHYPCVKAYFCYILSLLTHSFIHIQGTDLQVCHGWGSGDTCREINRRNFVYILKWPQQPFFPIQPPEDGKVARLSFSPRINIHSLALVKTVKNRNGAKDKEKNNYKERREMEQDEEKNKRKRRIFWSGLIQLCREKKVKKKKEWKEKTCEYKCGI